MNTTVIYSWLKDCNTPLSKALPSITLVTHQQLDHVSFFFPTLILLCWVGVRHSKL